MFVFVFVCAGDEQTALIYRCKKKCPWLLYSICVNNQWGTCHLCSCWNTTAVWRKWTQKVCICMENESLAPSGLERLAGSLWWRYWSPQYCSEGIQDPGGPHCCLGGPLMDLCWSALQCWTNSPNWRKATIFCCWSLWNKINLFLII